MLRKLLLSIVAFRNTGGPSYIRRNQSYLYRKKKSQKHTEKEYQDIIDKLVPELQRRYNIPVKALEIKHFCEQLKAMFNERYTQSLSYLEVYRIRRDIKLVLSIRDKLHRNNHILRVTDKSGVFHVSSAQDYERKVREYQWKTNAYIELSLNPLMDTFKKVVDLLNDLRSKNQITAWQQTKMMPNRNKMKIAYLYFIPKPHKVGIS